MALSSRLREYALLMRLDRPIGIFLLLWPTLWALLIAGEGRPDPMVLMVFILGVVLMRSAGCAINDFADRHIDGRVQRTRERPLATGLVRPREAMLNCTAVRGLKGLGCALSCRVADVVSTAPSSSVMVSDTTCSPGSPSMASMPRTSGSCKALRLSSTLRGTGKPGTTPCATCGRPVTGITRVCCSRLPRRPRAPRGARRR